QLPHTIANNSSTTSAVKVPTTYVSPFSKPLRPPIIPKQLPHTIANKLSNNLSSSSQNTTDTAQPTGQATTTIGTEAFSEEVHTNQTPIEHTETQPPENTETHPIEHTETHSAMTTRSQTRYLAFCKQFKSQIQDTQDSDTPLSEKVRRKYAKQRLELLDKLNEQWGSEDNRDYNEMFQAVMDAIQPLENEIKDPGVLVDMFASYLPVTANLIALQAIDQFIHLFPKNLQKHLQEVKVAEFVRLYPNSYNYLEELNEHGERSFYLYFYTKDNQSKRLYCIEPMPQFVDNFHVITTVALDIPARVPYGGTVTISSFPKGYKGKPLTIAKFTHSSCQFVQDVEFHFLNNTTFIIETPQEGIYKVFIAGFVDPNGEEEEVEEILTSESEEEENFQDIQDSEYTE
ncbi:attachment subunit-related family, partial [Trichomonas vaginalis G3]